MDLNWIWNALGALAAIFAATWGLIHLIATWSPHPRYQQWSTIRADQEQGSRPWHYANRQCRVWLIEVATRNQIRRVRVGTSVFYMVAILFATFLYLTAATFRDFIADPGWGSLVLYGLILGPWLIARVRSEVARGEAEYSVFGEKPAPFWRRLLQSTVRP